jgi:transposase
MPLKVCTGATWRDLPKRYPPYQTCHEMSCSLMDTDRPALHLL